MHDQANLLLGIAFSNAILALLIFLRNVKNLTNIFFAALNIAAALWAFGLAAFILSDSATSALFWAKEYYSAAALIAFFFVIFSANFTGIWQKFNLKYLLIALIPVIPVGVLIFGGSHLLLTDIVYHEWGKEVLLNKQGYLLYSVYFGSYVLFGFAIIYRALKKAHGLFKTYLKFLFNGLIVAFSLGATFNLFYPAFGNYRYIWVGPVFILFYTALTSYVIIKHKLFDIRAVAVRAVAYVSTLFIVSLLFIIPALILTSYLLDTPLSTRTLVWLALITLLSAILYQPLRRSFNKLTNRLFYRDYYEPQDVLNRLSDTLVRSVDPQEIQAASARIVKGALKPTWFGYLLVADKTLDALKEHELLRLLFSKKSDILVADEVDPSSDPQLHQALLNKGIAVAGALKTKTAHLGFMLLGHKQSGQLYSGMDIKTINIAADEIAISLQNALHFEEIRRFNITLQQRIEEATKELQIANTRLKELDKAKDEFISMASHQLRTPLTAIKGYLSMVLEGDIGPVTDNEKKMIKRAFDSAQKMVYLIADLLNVSRLQSGKLIIENKPTNLAEVVESEVAQLQETAQNRKIRLDYQKPASFPTQIIDENKTRQVIMNFLDNAIYYTPAGGTVTAAVQVNGQNVDFTVTDTGMGVPKEVQPHLFAKFYRADNARKMRPDGTGLGLFMAKKVIDAQGGTILFQSEEGKGSTFGFRFPLKSVQSSGTPRL